MSRFKEKLLKETPLNWHDINYFTDITIKKLEDMGLPDKDCKINSYFINSNDPNYNKLEYCLHNCGLKCRRK